MCIRGKAKIFEEPKKILEGNEGCQEVKQGISQNKLRDFPNKTG